MTFTLNTPMFDFLVLSIIAEGDAYGYQISQIIKRVSDTKDSALYPILKKLQENGYVCLLYTSWMLPEAKSPRPYLPYGADSPE